MARLLFILLPRMMLSVCPYLDIQSTCYVHVLLLVSQTESLIQLSWLFLLAQGSVKGHWEEYKMRVLRSRRPGLLIEGRI